MLFADLGLGPEILKAVEEAGYLQPTPIQEQAIPVVLMGRDVLGVAQTGTGKTAGFTLPMIEILAGSRAKARMPRSLILAPTRELASQVAENFEKYGKYHRLTMAKLIGGESFSDQEKLLDRGVDVLIATPGRLLDLYERGRILLNDVKILVIDEADRMLDMGFIPDVERIVSWLPKIRQTLFFSATMAPEIRRLADAFLMNPKEISVAPPASTAAGVEQFLVVSEEIDKREALRHLIRVEEVSNALIFCNRKRDVDILCRSLAKHGFDVVQLHGDMAQSARTETLDKFRRGEVRLMVCSDVAARGLDIINLSHVFNFDVPHHCEDYVHRIGRTGRAGKLGRAFTLATPADGKFVGDIIRLIGKEIPRVPIEGLPELALDMEGRRRSRAPEGRPARGGRKPGHDRNAGGERKSIRETDRPTPAPQEERPERKAEAERKPSREVARPAPVRHEERIAEAVPERPREAPRGGRDRSDRGDRFRRDRRHEEYHGIGEMSHADQVVGFGAHMPDFIRQTVNLPALVEKPAAVEKPLPKAVPAEPAPPVKKKAAAKKKAPAKPAKKAAPTERLPPTEPDEPAPASEAAAEVAPPKERKRRVRKAVAAPGPAAAEAPETPASEASADPVTSED